MKQIKFFAILSIVVLLFLTACTTITPPQRDISALDKPSTPPTTAKTEDPCDPEKVYPSHRYPGMEPGWTTGHKLESPYPICGRTVIIDDDAGMSEVVSCYDPGELRYAVEKVSTEYRKFLPIIEEMEDGWPKVNAARMVADAMCFLLPRYDNEHMPPTRQLGVIAIADPQDKLGGPTYPRLLLKRATQLQEFESAKKLVALFKEFANLAEDPDGGNCAISMNYAYSTTLMELLRVDLDAAEVFWKSEFSNFLVSKKIDNRHKPMDQWGNVSIEGHIKGVIKEKLQQGNYDYIRNLVEGERFGVGKEVLDDLAIDRLQEVYREAFLKEQLDADPSEATALQEEFDLSDEEMERSKVVGYADAGRGLSLDDPRFESLPHESRILIAGWHISEFEELPLWLLKSGHRFMRHAGVDPSEIEDLLALRLAKNAKTAYYYHSQGEKVPAGSHRGKVHAIHYAVTRLGFNPEKAYKPEICDKYKQPPSRYKKDSGIWFLRCNDGIKLAAQIWEQHPPEDND